MFRTCFVKRLLPRIRVVAGELKLSPAYSLALFQDGINPTHCKNLLLGIKKPARIGLLISPIANLASVWVPALTRRLMRG
jgi:hypothetical protein